MHEDRISHQLQFVCNVPSTIGAVLVYALPESNRVGRLIAFYCTNFTNGSLPMMFALTTTNIAGHTKRSTACAILFVGYSTAFIISPQFFLAMNISFNAVMWSLFTRALMLGSSTVQVSVINTSANFIITAVLGAVVFNESLPGLNFYARAHASWTDIP